MIINLRMLIIININRFLELPPLSQDNLQHLDNMLSLEHMKKMVSSGYKIKQI